jgi:cobalt-zinc-cadmium efflux system membrane fusion protein
LDLFKIADLSVLGVIAHVYEEDLGSLDSLPNDQRNWTIYLQSRTDASGIPATFDLIGNIVDPNQHTAAVMGWIENKDGRLRDGQFITAIVDLPSADDEVAIPESAVIEDGEYATVFVASSRDGRVVTRRHVAMVSRGQDTVFIRSKPTPEEAAQGCQPLESGEWVVAAGSIELDGALDSLLASAADHEIVKN